MDTLPARTIKLTIEYEGTEYYGWQTQKGTPTVQSRISQALKKITGVKVNIIGSGRTDRGVHALAQVAHFCAAFSIPTSKLPDALNANLPKDIRIVDAREVPETFHAQFAVRAKTYRYTVLNRPHPSALLRRTAYHVRAPLDLDFMRTAAAHLIGEHDFKAFTGQGTEKKTTVRRIVRLDIVKEGDLVHFTVTGNGFLYNMVRTIVGTLLLVGLKKLVPDDVRTIRDSRDRKEAGPNAPPQGLCLLSVEY